MTWTYKVPGAEQQRQANNLIIFLRVALGWKCCFLYIYIHTWCIQGSIHVAQFEEQKLIVSPINQCQCQYLRIWESTKPYAVWRKRESYGCANSMWEQQSPRKLRWSTIYLRCLRLSELSTSVGQYVASATDAVTPTSCCIYQLCYWHSCPGDVGTVMDLVKVK